MDNKLIPVILATFVGVLLIGSVLMPVIIDADDDTKVYYNNNFGPYAQVSDNETIAIEITTTPGTAGSTVYTVNGENVGVPQGPRAILLAENLTIYQNYSDGIACFGVDSDGNLSTFNNYPSIDVNIVGNSMTIVTTDSSNATTTYNFDCEWIFYRSNVGDYRLVDFLSARQTVYVNDLKQVYGSNRIGTTGEFFSFNGTDVKIAKLSDGTTTIREATATVTTTDVMRDVISFEVDPSRATSSSFKFITDNNGNDYEVYPYYFVIPASVYGQTESNEAYSAILFAIPVVLIMALVAIVIASFARYD